MIPLLAAIAIGSNPSLPQESSLDRFWRQLFNIHATDCAFEPPGRLGQIIEAAWQEADRAHAAPSEDDPQKETPRQKRERERHEQDVKDDVEIGKKYAAEAEKEFKPSENKEYIERVNRVGQEIAAIANANAVKVTWGDKRLSKFAYTFKVVKSKDEDQVNAFSLPGGFIFVFEGLVKYCESDDELAGIMAHEISHASLRHVATLQKEASKLQMITLPAILVAIFTGRGSTGAGAATAIGFIERATMSGWSQQAELASDYGGFQYMARSAYSPVGLLTFMERLARDKKTLEAIDWGIYRTHPPSKERAEALAGYLQEARIPIRRSAVSTSFRAVLKTNPDSTVTATFSKKPIFTFAGPDAMVRAEKAAVRLNDFFDSVPQLYELSFTPDGVIKGRKEILFRVLPEDAVAAKKTVDALAAEAVKNLKSSMYILAYRIWDAR